MLDGQETFSCRLRRQPTHGPPGFLLPILVLLVTPPSNFPSWRFLTAGVQRNLLLTASLLSHGLILTFALPALEPCRSSPYDVVLCILIAIRSMNASAQRLPPGKLRCSVCDCVICVLQLTKPLKGILFRRGTCFDPVLAVGAEEMFDSIYLYLWFSRSAGRARNLLLPTSSTRKLTVLCTVLRAILATVHTPSSSLEDPSIHGELAR